VLSHVRRPLSRRLVQTRRRTARDSGVAGLAGEAIVPLAQNNSLALRVGTNDPGGACNVWRTRSYRPRHLDFRRLFRGTTTLIYSQLIVCRLRLRLDRTSVAQHQTGQDDDQAVL
jgi:hypothetical protein